MAHDASDARPRRSRRVAIIGAGPGGICTGVSLLARGHDDFVILEQAPGIGGTWFHNRYPGAECDIKSHLYSFSFAPNPAWSRRYARQPEIKAYLEDVVDRFGLARTCASPPRCARCAGTTTRRCGTSPSATARVRARRRRRRERDRHVRRAGRARRPGPRPVRGHDVPLRRLGRRPRPHRRARRGHRQRRERGAAHPRDRADRRRRSTVYQRSANWVSPKEDDPYTEEELAAFAADPDALQASRDEIFTTIDPNLTFADAERRALAESVRPRATSSWSRTTRCARSSRRTCRSGASDRWRRTSTTPRSTCRTSSWSPTRSPRSPSTASSPPTARRARSTRSSSPPASPPRSSSPRSTSTGRNGVDIDDAWSDGPQAYLGITTTGFPNLFMLYGPNTNNGSIIYMIECQVDYVMEMLDAWTSTTSRGST